MSSGRRRRRSGGFEADVSCYATSVLCNALGDYKPAMEAARAFLEDANGRWAPALPELVEAAMRCGQPELARRAVDQLALTTAASGSDLAAGLECLCRALIAGDDGAEPLFAESLDHLGQTRIVTSFARAKLCTGSGSAARAAGSTHGNSFAPPATFSPRWAPRPSPRVPGAS